VKIYIAVDAEGVSGVFRPPDEMLPDTRLMMTRDANAAVAGARAAGADEVYLWDCHDGGKTLLYEELDGGAEYIQGYPVVERYPGLDATFAGVFLVGYHAMGGTLHSVCDHTMSSAMWQHIWINGRMMGEIGLDALWVGRLGVPVLLVTGDDKTCAEAREFIPNVVTAQVKVGLGRHLARMLGPRDARRLIFEKAQEAVANRANAKPIVLEPPYEVKLKYASTAHIDHLYFDGTRRIRVDGQTVMYRTDDLVAALARQP
jgi:D-amino peptidase